MKSSRFPETVLLTYNHIEIALWAALLAFVIYFLTFVIPKLPETQAQAQRIRAEEIAAENATLCEKLNVKRGTAQHNQCLLDVGQFRWKVEKRVYDVIDW
jgi:hypothetical protein